MERATAMRVKVPCNDEGDFYVRLADHVAEHGLKVPSRHPLPIGDRLRVTLEFRDGGTLSGEAVVAEHVRLGEESGAIVRFVRFDRSASVKPQRATGAKPASVPPPRPSQIAVAPPPAPPPVAPPSEADVEIPEISGAEEIASPTEAPNGSGAPSRLALMAGKMRAAAARGRAAAAKGGAAAIRQAMAALGRVDILIHSIQHRGAGYLTLFEDTTIEQLELQVAVNFMSAVRACKLIVPRMKSQGAGTIILVTSAAAEYEMPGMPGQASTGLGYPMTKAALTRFMMALAKETRQDNIAVIGLDPGFIFSEHVEVGRVGHDYHGWDSRLALPMDVPAETARYLCTCPDPMQYSGKNIRAADFVREHGLWSPAQ